MASTIAIVQIVENLANALEQGQPPQLAANSAFFNAKHAEGRGKW